MNSNANVKIHNRFDIEVVRDGEVIQRGQAENIVLNRMYTKLCNFSTYFANIVYGSGTGTLDPARTTLFTRINSAAATTVETIKAFPVSKWTRKIVLGLTTNNNQWLREVGISDETTAINTHALITDVNGEPLEIYKTELDIITIYATVFIELQNKDENNFFISLPNSNALLNYLVGGSAPNPTVITDPGENGKNVTYQTGSLTPTKTISVLDKKITYSGQFSTASSKGAIRALVLNNVYKTNLLASSIWTPYSLTNQNLGVGDGLIQTFNLLHPENVSNLIVKVDGSVIDSANYTLGLTASNNFAKSVFSHISDSELPTTRVSGLDGVERSVSGSSVSIVYEYPINSQIINKTFVLYIRNHKSDGSASAILAASNDGINFVTLKTVSQYGAVTNIETYKFTENYSYLRFIGKTNKNTTSYFKHYMYEDIQQIIFNTPPGLVTAESLGSSDRIENTFELANNPIITVQGDPEGDPPTSNEYALTVKFDDVEIEINQYVVTNNEIVFSTPPGLMYGEELGIGDGSNDTFMFRFTPDTINGIYIDSVLVDPADYTVTNDEIVFDTPPALDKIVSADYEYSCAITADYRYECEITADYTVPYIPKTADNVLDVSMEITFGG